MSPDNRPEGGEQVARAATGTPERNLLEELQRPAGRRSFLKWTGASVAVFAVAACDDDDPFRPDPDGDVNLGSGDIGILNYAYALEQLEAAFYIQVASSFYAGASDAEQQILRDIRDHEIAHRDFFAAAIPSASRIPELTPDFGAVNFSSRASVLGTAQIFEDLGVSAYNGAGPLLEDGNFLLAAGKIVSVEARHASVIRDLLMPGTAFFAGDDIVDNETGLEVARTPAEVLLAAQPFITETIIATGLPTS